MVIRGCSASAVEFERGLAACPRLLHGGEIDHRTGGRDKNERKNAEENHEDATLVAGKFAKMNGDAMHGCR